MLSLDRTDSDRYDDLFYDSAFCFSMHTLLQPKILFLDHKRSITPPRWTAFNSVLSRQHIFRECIPSTTCFIFPQADRISHSREKVTIPSAKKSRLREPYVWTIIVLPVAPFKSGPSSGPTAPARHYWTSQCVLNLSTVTSWTMTWKLQNFLLNCIMQNACKQDHVSLCQHSHFWRFIII